MREVQSNELYCKACKKLFQNEHTFVNHLPGKKHTKNVKAQEKQLASTDMLITEKGQEEQKVEDIDLNEQNRKKLAYLESYIVRMKELLGDVIHDTMNLIRKK